ncbi:putative LIGNIN PEROXIDASE LIPJ [Mycobacterium xenopi 3993]|nr:putative LIGNIN PEROXIDASE LIPJ [Mycobacterium xenopi 3993]
MVLDAVCCTPAAIFAPSFNAMIGLVLAADYPERVRSLVIVNGAARVQRSPPSTRAIRRARNKHGRRRIRGDVHQSDCCSCVRGRDRRCGTRARDRSADGYPRG